MNTPAQNKQIVLAEHPKSKPTEITFGSHDIEMPEPGGLSVAEKPQ